MPRAASYWSHLEALNERFRKEGKPPAMKRRAIRALVVPTRTQYWIDRGQHAGVEYELLTAFGADLNRKQGRAHGHLGRKSSFRRRATS